MPETEHDARGKKGLPSVVRRDNGMHERKETGRFVKYLHIDIKYDMSILRLKSKKVGPEPNTRNKSVSYLHEQFNSLRKGRYGLLWLFLGPRMFHAIRTIPILLSNQAYVSTMTTLGDVPLGQLQHTFHVRGAI